MQQPHRRYRCRNAAIRTAFGVVIVLFLKLSYVNNSFLTNFIASSLTTPPWSEKANVIEGNKTYTMPAIVFTNNSATMLSLINTTPFRNQILNTETAGVSGQELLARSAIRRNQSNQLCGAIPHASEKSRQMPVVLTLSKTCRANAILYMVQKGKHASYDRNSTALFLKSLDLLYQNYLSVNEHATNVDLLIVHTGDYNVEDLHFLTRRYNDTVHFKLIDLSNTDYWTVPAVVRDDDESQWLDYPKFGFGYRHMIRWYALKLYDFARDFGTTKGGCQYKYLMRMDEDSFLYSSIAYDLFDFMQSNNYAYSYRMCSFEMDMTVWHDYVDHVQYCGGLLPPHVPHRQLEMGLCGFYNNFFIIHVPFVLQPDVQHFLQWVDATGIVYRERYNDLQIQTIAVYAFLPPERIHRFLDWTYEHMTSLTSAKGIPCPVMGSLQAGYLDKDWKSAFDRFNKEYSMKTNRCLVRRRSLSAANLSPTYSHLPPPSWWNETYGVALSDYRWRTFANGDVEFFNRGILSG